MGSHARGHYLVSGLTVSKGRYLLIRTARRRKLRRATGEASQWGSAHTQVMTIFVIISRLNGGGGTSAGGLNNMSIMRTVTSATRGVARRDTFLLPSPGGQSIVES